MFIRSCAVLLVACALAPQGGADDEPKKADGKDVWAKIVTDLVTPEVSKKGVEIQANAAVPGDFELNFDVKKLGAEGKFSAKAIKEKYGPPAKVEKYATREDGKVVTYEKLHYPPIAFTVPAGGDQVTLISAPKRLWGGEGILENASAALKGK
jgi:hypothetical protein